MNGNNLNQHNNYDGMQSDNNVNGNNLNQPNNYGMQPDNNMNGNNLNQPNNYGMQTDNNMNQYNNSGVQTNSPQFSNYNNYPNNGNNGFKDNKKMIYIIIGVVALVAVAMILYFAVFKKDKGYEDYNDNLKNEEKLKEKLNENFTINNYKTQDGILVELKNNNDIPVSSSIKIEFYDENGNVVNVEEGYTINTAAKGKGYDEIHVDEDIKYATYKVTAKLVKASAEKTYNDKIEIVSNTKQNDSLIIRVKNNSDVELSAVELGLIFIDKNNTIIDYEVIYIVDLGAGETVSEKGYIPYDFNTFDEINYQKVDIVVVSAVK